MWSGKEQLNFNRVSWKGCYLKEKFGGLGLVDLAKTSLLCKWIVIAMEPGESNLQFMLWYRLPRFHLPKNIKIVGGLALIGSLISNIKYF